MTLQNYTITQQSPAAPHTQNWLSTNRTIILNIGDFSPNTTIAQFSKLDNSSEYSTQSGHMQLAPVSTKNHKSL